jgi:hypothetical protein
VRALHDRGVTHIVVHQEAFESGAGAVRFQQIATMPMLRLVARDGDVSIYRVVR